MEFTWLDFLETHEKEDVSAIRNVISSKKDNMKSVVEAAFSGHPYVTKQEAKLLIESEFTDSKKIPAGLDLDWIVTNKSEILSKIDLMTEHEIKIIINAQDKGSAPSVTTSTMPSSGSSCSGSCDGGGAAVVVGEPVALDVEMEGKKRGRGRPRKIPLSAPIPEKEALSEEEELVKKLTEMGYTVKKANECAGSKILKRESAFDYDFMSEDAGEPEETEEHEAGETKEEEASEDVKSDGLDISWDEIMSKLYNGDGAAPEEEEEDGTSKKEYEDDDGLGTPAQMAGERQKEINMRGLPGSAKKEAVEADDKEPIDEEGDPLDDDDEKEELKKIDAKNPKFAEYLKGLRDRTRSGVKTKMSDMNDMMRDATAE